MYFENTVCLKCNHTVGFNPHELTFITLNPGTTHGTWHDVKRNEISYRFCTNAQHATCNWLIPLSSASEFCVACVLNRTIPQLSGSNVERWNRIEIAKHRLIYSLLKLNLPVQSKTDDNKTGLVFDFLADIHPEERVMTGHSEGVITLNIEEADEAERVKNKLDLGERYRTLLGHFRHEIGHYYWDTMIHDNKMTLQEVRHVFGDDAVPYDKALQNYYANGPAMNWSENFISPYATSHPWEDWAETWAHYLHLMDTLETAYYFGVGVRPEKATGITSIGVQVDRDPYTVKNFQDIFNMWLPLTFAVNSLNRSMGHPDFYPFIVAPAVVEKLSFVHAVCQRYR